MPFSGVTVRRFPSTSTNFPRSTASPSDVALSAQRQSVPSVSFFTKSSIENAGPLQVACGAVGGRPYPGGEAEARRSRNLAASVVGWMIVVIVAWLVLRSLIGVLGWALRGIVVIVLLVVLINFWFRLKARE